MPIVHRNASVVERLKQHYPGHDIVTKESSGHQTVRISMVRRSARPHHELRPRFSVCNDAGAGAGGRLIPEVVYDPNRDEMFAAEQGGGARLNGDPIRVSSVMRLEDSLSATDSQAASGVRNVNIHFYYQLAIMTRGEKGCGRLPLTWRLCRLRPLRCFLEFNLNRGHRSPAF